MSEPNRLQWIPRAGGWTATDHHGHQYLVAPLDTDPDFPWFVASVNSGQEPRMSDPESCKRLAQVWSDGFR